MRIRMRLPEVDPEIYEMPEECPYDSCLGQHFKSHQPECRKELLDPNHRQVTAKRYRCLRCRRTFRLYPRGVSRAQRSDRLRDCLKNDNTPNWRSNQGYYDVYTPTSISE